MKISPRVVHLALFAVILAASLVAAQPVYVCNPPPWMSAAAAGHDINLLWGSPPAPITDPTVTLSYDRNTFYGFGPSDSLYSVASVRFSPTAACTLTAAQVFLYSSPTPYDFTFNLRFFENMAGGYPGGLLDARYPQVPVIVPSGAASEWYTVDLSMLHLVVNSRRDFHVAFEKTDSLLFLGSDGSTTSYNRSWLWDPSVSASWAPVAENWKIRVRIRYRTAFMRESVEEWVDVSPEPRVVGGYLPEMPVRHLPPAAIRPFLRSPELTQLKYKISRSTSEEGGFDVIDSTLDTFYVDTTISDMTRYYYTVQAFWDSCSAGPCHDTVNALTFADPIAARDTLRNCAGTDSSMYGYRWGTGNSFSVVFDAPGPCKLLELQYFLVRPGRFRVGFGNWMGICDVDTIADSEPIGGHLETRAWATVTPADIFHRDSVFLNSPFVVWFTYVDTMVALGFDSMRTSANSYVRRGSSGCWIPEPDCILIRAVVQYGTGEIRMILSQGWNMVGLPLLPTDRRAIPSEVFPSASSPAYTILCGSGTYSAVDSIRPAEGYFVLIPRDTVYMIPGHPVYADSTILCAGWSLVGAVYPLSGRGGLPIAELDQLPPGGIVTGSSYWFSPAARTYIPITTLYPGRGAFLLSAFPLQLRLRY